MTSPRERPSVGSLINGWQVIEDDLQGRAGWVFIVCRDSDPERIFALKMWRGDLDNPLQNPIVNESNRIRAAKLPDILPTVIESGEWQGRPYFVMERLDDIDWPLPDKAYRRVAIEAFEALAQLHSRHILHCDITARHLALKKGKVALLDLDNARAFEEVLSNRDSIGTDPYISPEGDLNGIRGRRLEIKRQLDASALVRRNRHGGRTFHVDEFARRRILQRLRRGERHRRRH